MGTPAQTAEEPARWHSLAPTEVLAALDTDQGRGLSQAEAQRRLARWGANALPPAARLTALRLFLDQFTDLMVLILMVAVVVSLALREWVDAGAIGAILVLNAVLGFLQEYRAERSLEALERLSAPQAKVLRDGALRTVDAADLVPGDIVRLEAGDIVPADARLLSAHLLRLQEALLTGESVPVDKQADAVLAADAELGDRVNMVYSSTLVAYGSAWAVVVATGPRTEAGRLAALVQAAGRAATPLQRRLAQTGRRLIAAALLIAGLLFIIGVIRGQDVADMFLTAVALAVAAIPEGLPAAVTIVLALGVQRMVRRHAIVRRLESVETLGATTVICTDKTGTLTQNRLTARQLYVDGQLITVAGDGDEFQGRFLVDGQEAGFSTALRWALTVAALCNTARLSRRDDAYEVIGDPTEGALLVLAAKAGLLQEELQARYRFVDDIPFDSERRRMTSVYLAADGQALALSKGAPEVILDRCTHILSGEGTVPLSPAASQAIEQQANEMAAQGRRVLGLAYRPLPSREVTPAVEEGLVFLGLVGLIDPLRPEAKAAVESCRRAGIRILILTGDHKQTALAIARELAIAPANGDTPVLSGRELEALTEAELDEALGHVAVYARVSGEHKLRLVKALHRQRQIVAMTGDGVNDAPALKEADIGIAMGLSGTEVAKQASDMVLTDDNFSSIVAAVEEGRTIYANIRRFIFFLLSCNLGEILFMFLPALVAAKTALLPVQILWVNLVTDSLPALALGMEPPRGDQMQRPPRSPTDTILAASVVPLLLFQAVCIAIPALIAFWYGLSRYGSEEGRELAFITIALAQLFAALNFRSTRLPLVRIGLAGNPSLLAAVAAALGLQLLPFYLPFLNDVFGVSPLSAADWLFVLPLATIAFWPLELAKLARLRR